MHKKEYSMEVGGKPLRALFTDLADQAHGSVIVYYEGTAILATAVMSKYKRDDDFFPLTVDFEERFYAGGKILGSRFVRREGRPSEGAILSGRIIDRTIRPLFDQNIRNEVQVIITVLALGKGDPDAIGVIAASLAIGTSQIPWDGPVSSVKIGKKKGEKTFMINPSWNMEDSGELEIDLLACGKDGLINMIEVGSKECDEATAVKALKEASNVIETIQEFQKKIISEKGRAKIAVEKTEIPKVLADVFAKEVEPKLLEEIFSGPGHERTEKLQESWLALVEKNFPENIRLALVMFEERINEIIHREAIENNRRADGRGMDDIRPLYVKAGGVSSVLHGSGIFYRGGTHVLSVLTLGGPKDSQLIDGMEGEEDKRFIHHYNFPPFSTGETGKVGSTNRRMIGHGALAEKALLPVIPSKEIFPYTIRIVSEALASNGSTSMGSVCGSTLALMDAGVPIKAPVAGIASGLMMREKKSILGKKKYEYKLMTDIQGPEDHYGDMDFKVAGTRQGITAIQMDVKVNGIPIDVLEEAFEKAKAARLRILDAIEKEIAGPRPKLAASAPEIITTKVKEDQIGLIIGSGGKTINEMKKISGVDEIDIDDDGTIFITGKNGTAEKAKVMIEEMTHEYKAGEKFEGEVTRIMDFGAFVRIGRNAEGLVHISEIAPEKVERISGYLKIGDKVPVLIKEIDEKGRINLSIRRASPNFFKKG